MPTPAFWRQWHRWIHARAVFLVLTAITGALVAGTEFFGDDEAVREANRALISTVRTSTPTADWWAVAAGVFADAASRAGGARRQWRLHNVDRPGRTGVREIVR